MYVKATVTLIEKTEAESQVYDTEIRSGYRRFTATITGGSVHLSRMNTHTGEVEERTESLENYNEIRRLVKIDCNDLHIDWLGWHDGQRMEWMEKRINTEVEIEAECVDIAMDINSRRLNDEWVGNLKNRLQRAWSKQNDEAIKKMKAELKSSKKASETNERIKQRYIDRAHVFFDGGHTRSRRDGQAIVRRVARANAIRESVNPIMSVLLGTEQEIARRKRQRRENPSGSGLILLWLSVSFGLPIILSSRSIIKAIGNLSAPAQITAAIITAVLLGLIVRAKRGSATDEHTPDRPTTRVQNGIKEKYTYRNGRLIRTDFYNMSGKFLGSVNE